MAPTAVENLAPSFLLLFPYVLFRVCVCVWDVLSFYPPARRSHSFDDNQQLLPDSTVGGGGGGGQIRSQGTERGTGGDACHHRRPESDRRRLHEIPPIATARPPCVCVLSLLFLFSFFSLPLPTLIISRMSCSTKNKRKRGRKCRLWRSARPLRSHFEALSECRLS